MLRICRLDDDDRWSNDLKKNCRDTRVTGDFGIVTSEIENINSGCLCSTVVDIAMVENNSPTLFSVNCDALPPFANTNKTRFCCLNIKELIN